MIRAPKQGYGMEGLESRPFGHTDVAAEQARDGSVLRDVIRVLPFHSRGHH